MKGSNNIKVPICEVDRINARLLSFMKIQLLVFIYIYLHIRDTRRADVGGTIQIFGAVFFVPPVCMVGQILVPFSYLSKIVVLSFSTYIFALMSDINIVTSNITRMICCGFVFTTGRGQKAR
jgi:hypothetical protein